MAVFDFSRLRRTGGSTGGRSASLPDISRLTVSSVSTSRISGSGIIQLPGLGLTRVVVNIFGRFSYGNGGLDGGTITGFGYQVRGYGSFSIKRVNLDVLDIARAGNSLTSVNRLSRRLIAGDDIIIGSAQDDRFFGGPGDDTIVGGPGKDVIHGGSGVNRVTGGLGADVFRFQRGSGFTVVTDLRAGVDQLSLAGLGRVTSRRQGLNWELYSGDDLIAEFTRTRTDPLTS